MMIKNITHYLLAPSQFFGWWIFLRDWTKVKVKQYKIFTIYTLKVINDNDIKNFWTPAVCIEPPIGIWKWKTTFLPLPLCLFHFFYLLLNYWDMDTFVFMNHFLCKHKSEKIVLGSKGLKWMFLRFNFTFFIFPILTASYCRAIFLQVSCKVLKFLINLVIFILLNTLEDVVCFRTGM